MDLKLVLIAVLVALGIGALLWLNAGPADSSAAPEVLSVEFPEEIPADGSEVSGKVRFRDPDADVIEARFEVVEAELFDSFRFNPHVEGQSEGEFVFMIFSFFPQEIALRVVLVDRAGHRSEPFEFRFRAVSADLDDF
jgi:hypothetical protein